MAFYRGRRHRSRTGQTTKKVVGRAEFVPTATIGTKKAIGTGVSGVMVRRHRDFFPLYTYADGQAVSTSPDFFSQHTPISFLSFNRMVENDCKKSKIKLFEIPICYATYY
jgi:hypothetical protein